MIATAVNANATMLMTIMLMIFMAQVSLSKMKKLNPGLLIQDTMKLGLTDMAECVLAPGVTLCAT
jgi:hypothetical protein